MDDLELEIYRRIGEPKTTERVQQEPWYSDYQQCCEIMNAGPVPGSELSYYERTPNGFELALAACLKSFEYRTVPPSDEKISLWIKSCWLTEEHMRELDEKYGHVT